MGNKAPERVQSTKKSKEKMKSRNGNKEKYPDNSEVKRIEAAFKDKLIKNGVDTEAKSSVAPSADE